MAKIKKLIFCDTKKLKNVLKDSGFELEEFSFFSFFFALINSFLPIKWKFLSESFVAYDKNKVLGIITLERDNKSRKKFKISRLYLEQNSLDVGKMLIDYSTARYNAQGALSYQVTVEENRQDLVSLFVDGCDFRKSANEYLYKITNEDVKYEIQEHFEGFKPYKNENAYDVARLFNTNINSYQKISFSRNARQFNPEFARGLAQKISYSYVLEDESENKVYGYFCVSTYNNIDYVLDFVFEPTFEIYFSDALKYIALNLNKRVKKWNLYVKIKSFFINYNYFKQYIEDKNFNCVVSSCILTKDYLKTVKEKHLINNAKIIFNDATPAFKVKTDS